MSETISSIQLDTKKKSFFWTDFRRNLLAGILTLIPIWVTWLVFSFVVGKLSEMGAPWVRALSVALREHFPAWADYLLNPWTKGTLAVVLTILALYVLGFLTSQVIGKRVLQTFDALITKIPFVETIYGSTKTLLEALQSDHDRMQRVVLIDFPSDSMKTIGFVTALLKDEISGQELAAVYVPTTPNPTSGYLEIVPADKIIPTSLTMDEAMTFIISGGAVAPKTIPFTKA